MPTCLSGATARALMLVLVAVLASACAAPDVYLEEDLSVYETEIDRLERHLIDEPGDAEALRDLGVIYMRTQHFMEGNRYLQQAFTRDADDPKTLFYLGLSNELLGRWDTALRIYGQDVSRLSPYRRLMRGRAQHLRRLQAQREVVELLASEEVDTAPTSPRIVAVFPLAYQGDDNRYAPLGRGLSEMVMTDLASVNTLKLVERVRLQALLDELELGQSQYVDPQSAPRTGRLLGAGRLVGGNFAVEDDNLLLDVAMVSSVDAATRALETTSGDLDDLFDVQKQLVFRLIEEMGIELTPAERERIQSVPTRNLQAFLAYSQGLQAEDAGQFGAAERHFQRASELDPGFTQATDRAETAGGMEATAGTTEEVLSAAVALEPPPSRPIDLVNHRIGVMNATLTGTLIPGDERRTPAQEGTPLGEPPPPPAEQ